MVLIRGKKSQIDIALTVGSIVIPVVVLLGALMFAWAMISPVTNAGRTAGLVNYDVARMIDIAYSVPDDIKINYKPATMCQFASDLDKNVKTDFLVCFDGFMNISDFSVNLEAGDTQYPMPNYTGNVVRGTAVNYPPSALLVNAKASFAPDVVDAASISSPVDLTYTAFADSRDAGMLLVKNELGGIAKLDINKSIVIEKERTNFFDSIITPAMYTKQGDADYNEKLNNIIDQISADPIEEIVVNSNKVCSAKTSSQDITVFLPPTYYVRAITSETENKLCLYKAGVFPDVTAYMTNYKQNNSHSFSYTGWTIDSEKYTGLDLRYYKDDLSGMKYNESLVYCFDFYDMPYGCTYDLNQFNYAGIYGSTSSSGVTANYALTPDLYYPAGYDTGFATVTIKNTNNHITYDISEHCFGSYDVLSSKLGFEVNADMCEEVNSWW